MKQILHRAYLALGSNLGDKHDYLEGAVKAISAIDKTVLVARSSDYETLPYGDPNQANYLNAVVGVDTELTHWELFKACRDIEHQFGRVRSKRNEARTLDIDLIYFSGVTINEPELKIPHPRMHERDFVLIPLMEIAGEDFTVMGEALKELVARISESYVLVKAQAETA